jgi:hypothetical protein
MLKYELKFYDGSTKLTGNSDDNKDVIVNEFNRIKNMSTNEISMELGLNNDITVTHIVLMDNRNGKIIKKHSFE